MTVAFVYIVVVEPLNKTNHGLLERIKPHTNAFVTAESPFSTLLTITITTIIIALPIVHNPFASDHYHYFYVISGGRSSPPPKVPLYCVVCDCCLCVHCCCCCC